MGEMNHDIGALDRELARRAPSGHQRGRREAGGFQGDLDGLIGAGLLRATVPASDGGGGLCGAAGAAGLCDLLEQLGAIDLSLGRVFEAHVNALDLIRRYGTGSQFAAAAALARTGVLFGLWVTDPPSGGAVLAGAEGGRLAGAKHFCSAAGIAGRALITVGTPAGTRMVLIETVPPLRVTTPSVGLSGMHAAATGGVMLDGIMVAPEAMIGQVDDYLREPVFSGAAWRNYAVMLGGARRLIGLGREMLQTRGRTGNGFQRMRFGEAVIAWQSAALWLREAAVRAETAMAPGEDAVAFVNLARIATETACLDVIRLIQRSIGVAAFIEGSEMERVARDLAVYLRQPGPDEALDRAGAYCLERLSGAAIVP